jgi:hypothetical protein
MTLNAKTNTYSDVPPYKCLICGAEESAPYYCNKRMVDAKQCFTCNFWDEYAQPEALKKSIRIAGEHYMVGEKTKDSRFNGFGGREFTIKTHEGIVIKTNNLWYQGVIPDYFKSKIPDNAEFVKTPEAIGHGQGFLGEW